MLPDELKCLEVLIRYITDTKSMDKQARSEFDSISAFEYAKTNLFALVTISILIENYHKHPSFSLESFLENGAIEGRFNTPIVGPTIDVEYRDNYKGFYSELIKALKEGNYTFDNENNIIISSEKIETIISLEWLFRLAEGFKKETYKRVYFYNKNFENDITDKNSLLNYLYHTKTFFVELSCDELNPEFSKTFKEAKEKTDSIMRGKSPVKVDDIIKCFSHNLDDDYKARLTKFKIPAKEVILKYAERMGDDFYHKPLEVQQEYINKWLVDYIESQKISQTDVQKFLVLSELDDQNSYNRIDNKLNNNEISRGRILTGLVTLYISLLNNFDIDYQNLSLTDFKNKIYVPESLQEHLVELNEIIKTINERNNGPERQALREKIEKLKKSISKIDTANNPEKLAQETSELQECLYRFQEEEYQNQTDLEKRNSLQNLIHLEQSETIDELSFDNEKIISLIKRAVSQGRVFIDPLDSSKLVFELYNDELAKITFQTKISIENFIKLVESINYSIEENPCFVRRY